MKPSFALTLSHDSIGLLHRTPNGWLSIGSVALDDPDLAQALDYLRGTALGLEPQGFATKVVIPNSEILYDTVHAPGPKPAQRRAQIAAALEGRTPYALDELAFDWSGTGEWVQVAVVARETLAEAEAFATEHRFNPVSFVAIPEPGGFAAEPWFGQTAAAAGLLAPGEKVVRDQDPMRVIQRVPARSAAAAATAPAAEDGAAAHPGTAPAEAATGPADPAADVTLAPAPAPAGEAAPELAPEMAAEMAPAPEAAPDAPAEQAPGPEPAAPEPAPGAVTEPALPAAAAASAEAGQPEAAPPPAETAAEGAGPPALPKRPAPGPLPALSDDGDQTLAWPGEDDGAVMTRAQAELAASLAPPPVPSEPLPGPGARRAPDLADLPPPISAPVQRALAAARAGREGGTVTSASASAAETGAALSDKVQKALGKAAKGAKAKVKPPVQRPAMAPPPPPLPPSATQPQVPPARSEAEKMTVFGERRAPVRGKPRFLGLILTGVLLLILLGVAVWAALMLEPEQQGADGAPGAEVAVLAPPGAQAVAPGQAEAPATAPPPVADLPQDEALPEAPPVETAAAAEPEPVAAAPAPAEPAPVLAEGSRTVAEAAPSGTQTVSGDFTLPGTDPALAAPVQARLAALPPAGADRAPTAPGALPEFGALYRFDAEGNILPTPDGVVTPDGVRLVAARPARVPPPRPADAAPPAPAAEPGADPAADAAAAPQAAAAPAPAPGAIAILPAPGAPTAQDAAFAPDTAAPRRRPPQRPAGLAPAAAPEAPVADEGALPGPAATGFASRRPPPRPASVVAAAKADEAERARAVAAAAAAAAASASTALAAEASAMPATRRPAARPEGFARNVQAAVTAAIAPPVATSRTRPAEPEPEEVVATAAAPDRRNISPRIGAHPDDQFDDGEPDAPTVVTNAPTPVAVARQATVTGALNLGRTNLIGVFGTANARYALVRESGGRLVRVKVGDRVDGGRVVAIGASDLSYQRGGNTVRLTMPRG